MYMFMPFKSLDCCICKLKMNVLLVHIYTKYYTETALLEMNVPLEYMGKF